MKPPRMSSVVERRLLVNYRVDPEMLTGSVPAPMRLKLVDGWAVAGICLIRLGQFRPRGLPRWVGVRSENAAHRIAVEWDGPQGRASGVYISRRHSDSPINAIAGGRLFPGQHGLAQFDVHETDRDLHVGFTSPGDKASVSVDVRKTERLQGSELFDDLAEASEFFRNGAIGYSPARDSRRLDGLELHTDAWEVEAVEVLAAQSSFFDDPNRFPPGSATLDCALLMREVPVNWRPISQLRVASATKTARPMRGRAGHPGKA